MKKYKIAVLDDYQNVALESADWSILRDRADIAVFQNHLADPDAVIERLLPFDVVCAMRERTPLPRNVIERLPNLKLIASTGSGNASIDVAAAGEHGIAVVHTGSRSLSCRYTTLRVSAGGLFRSAVIRERCIDANHFVA